LREYTHSLKDATDFEQRDKLYSLQTELNHKEYLLEQYENDNKARKEQRVKVMQIVNKDMGTLIGKLREKDGLGDMEYKIKEGIIKRFAKNDYQSEEGKISDFQMAQKLVDMETKLIKA